MGAEDLNSGLHGLFGKHSDLLSCLPNSTSLGILGFLLRNPFLLGFSPIPSQLFSDSSESNTIHNLQVHSELSHCLRFLPFVSELP